MEKVVRKKQVDSVASAFIFNNYIIEDVTFKMNSDFEGSGSIDLDFDLDSDFYLNSDKNEAIVDLTCIVFPDYKEKNLPFHLSVKIIGNFTIKESFSSEEVANLCRINATALLFPYLRAFISNLTSLAGIPNLILPTINVRKLLYEK